MFDTMKQTVASWLNLHPRHAEDGERDLRLVGLVNEDRAGQEQSFR
jgi:hypothetical protein